MSEVARKDYYWVNVDRVGCHGHRFQDVVVCYDPNLSILVMWELGYVNISLLGTFPLQEKQV